MVELLLAGVVLRRWAMVAAATALLGACLVLPIDSWAIRPLEDRFPQVASPPPRVDGVIVLGGAIDAVTSEDRGTPTLNAGANRITTFAILSERYPAARLVFTGGSGTLEQGLASEAPYARDLLLSLGVAPDRVLYEGASRTTWENAVEVNRLVQPRPGEIWVLLTSAAHMPRSMGVFRAAGWDTMLAWPVGYRSRRHASTFPLSLGDKLAVLDTAGHEWAGLLAYWLAGHSAALFPAP